MTREGTSGWAADPSPLGGPLRLALARLAPERLVSFVAAKGKSNALVITISVRTVTLDDKVAIKAGTGRKAVKGDKTKVKCTTSKKTTVSVDLGNLNDTVANKTSVVMQANGKAGNDTLVGGSGADQLMGLDGNDTIYGGNGGVRGH